MSILFPTDALLFEMIPSFSPSTRSILSFLNGVCFVHPKLSLFFPALPHFFFKDSDFLIMYPFICGKSLHSFLSMFLSGDFPWRCSTVSSSSSFVVVSSPVDPIQATVLIIALSSFQMLSHAGISLNHSPLAIQLFRSAEDISEDSCIHSASILTISRLLPHSSYLIQPAQSFF